MFLVIFCMRHQLVGLDVLLRAALPTPEQEDYRSASVGWEV
jgi:hypothetical protein